MQIPDLAIESNARSIPMRIDQSFSVQYKYCVHFTRDLFNIQNPLLQQLLLKKANQLPTKVLLLIDEGLLAKQPNLITAIQNYFKQASKKLFLCHQPVLIPGGEAAKNDPKWVDTLLKQIHSNQLCRHAVLLAIGGGAVLDLAGFTAAIAHRGMRLIRIPTTVLSQNDSGVGVKTSINYFHKKNFLGTFTPPYAVINDPNFLTTLDNRNWRAGIAEAIKVALLKDNAFFEYIVTHTQALLDRDLLAMEKLIFHCARLHVEHIGQYGDPFETGDSKPLDLGHWAAHKLEQLTDYRILHGEAVAIGLALDATYSYLVGSLSKLVWKKILSTLAQLQFTLFIPELESQLESPADPKSLFAGLTEFQEHLGGMLSIVLLNDIGKTYHAHDLKLDLFRQAIEQLKGVQHANSSR